MPPDFDRDADEQGAVEIIEYLCQLLEPAPACRGQFEREVRRLIDKRLAELGLIAEPADQEAAPA